MRHVPDQAMDPCRGSRVPSGAMPMACFITTEAILDASCETSKSTASSDHSPDRRKQRVASPNQHSRSQLPSPARTGTSHTSLSSSVLDLDLELDSGADASHGSPLARDGSPSISCSKSTISTTSSERILGPEQSFPHRGRSLASSTQATGHVACSSLFTGTNRHHDPQLIMPSLAVPDRRPYTDTGRSLGKLKVLVAGRSGIGKKSLIQSIARTCEHIVHIDPAVTSAYQGVEELCASTRPRPWWRMQSESTQSARKRSFSTSEVLDRNLSFIVSSASHQRPTESRQTEVDYVRSQLEALLERPIDDAHLESLVSAGGEAVVDAVLYLIPHSGLTSTDIACITALQDKTNVIPLLARSDEMNAAESMTAQKQIARELEKNGLKVFVFDDPAPTRDPFILTVSSACRAEHDVMDASVLMSSTYLQPLMNSDLQLLVDLMFSMDGSARLRHMTAKKCIQLRSARGGGSCMQMALTRRHPAQHAITPVLTTNPFVQRGSWPNLEVTDWAHRLRQSLESEKLHAISIDHATGDIPCIRGPRELIRHKRISRNRKFLATVNMQHQDPLGLLELGSQFRRNGRLAMELLSSLGVVGCVATLMGGPEWGCQGVLRRTSRHVFGLSLPIY